jgi:hypothetical protein
MVKAQTTTVSVTPQSSKPAVGKTFTISITISNVENLYGLDVTLNWNPSILSYVSHSLDLGNSGGVLSGSPVSSTATSGGILLQTDTATQSAGEYDLVATSESPASSFNGSGTILTMTFSVLAAGTSPLTLVTQLADHPLPDQTSEFITHTDVSGTVTAGSTSTSPTPSSPPTTTPTSSSSSPLTSASPTPKVPEFPLIAMLTLVVGLASAAVGLSVKKILKPPVNA